LYLFRRLLLWLRAWFKWEVCIIWSI
jgi:hypothetical protein